MAKLYGKKYTKAVEGLDLLKKYSTEEALELVKKTNTAKFDGTVEVHVKLTTNPTKADQGIRSTTTLPNGTGKKVRVIAFVSEKDEKAATDAGADEVGTEKLIEKITKGWLAFDIAVATPDMMPKIAKVAKILGSRGMMPNPKVGTVTPNFADTIRDFKKGKIEFRADSLAGIHAGIGKVSFTTAQLKENFDTFVTALVANKPSSVKGPLIKSIAISSTMGPGIKVETSKLG
ncbi:MAG: 50S ribosomal protein L1 [Patescibacteria group bacterium]